MRAYRRADKVFAAHGDGLRDQGGADWRVTDDALIGPTGALARIPGHGAYWFAWAAFHPGSDIFQGR